MSDFLIIDDRSVLADLDSIAFQPPLNPVIVPSVELAVVQLAAQPFAVMVLNADSLPGRELFSAASRLRESAPETPLILLLPATADWQALSAGQQLPLLDYLIGPVDLSILRTRIAAMAALYQQNQPAGPQPAPGSWKRESEVKFHTLAENVTAAIFIFQGSGIKYVNRAAVDMTGFSERELLGMSFWEVLHPEVRESLREAGLARQQSDDAQAPHVETRLLTKDGQTCWIDVTLSRFEFEGQPAIFGTAFDITRRKFTEKVQQFETDIAVSLRAIKVPQEGLEIILAALLGATPFDCGGIYLLDDESGTLNLAAHQGLPASFVAVIQHVPPGDIRLEMVNQGKSVYQAVSAFPAGTFDELNAEGLQFLAIVPIIGRDGAIGALNLASHHFQTIDQADLNFLETVSATTLAALIAQLKTEEDLLASETRYRTILNDTSSVITRFLPGGVLTFVNKACCELYGKSAQELIGTSFFGSIPEPERSFVEQIISSLTPDNPSFTYEHSVLGRNGRQYWHQWTDRAIFDEYGRLIAYQSAGEDITDRKLAEAALRESEEKYRSIFYNSPLGILHFDRDGVITDCNGKFAEIIGSSIQTLIGFNMLQRLQDISLQTQVKAALASGEGYYEGDYRSVMADKVTPVRIYLNGIRNEAGEIVSGVGLIEDITASKKAEQARLSEAARFKALFTHAPLGIGILDREGRIISANAAVQKSHGYTPEELVDKFGTPFAGYAHPDDARIDQALFQEMVDGQRDFYSMEKRFFHKNGHVIWMQLSVAAVRDEKGELEYTLGFVQDITEYKLSEAALRRSEARFARFMDNFPGAAYIRDREGRLVYCNQFFASNFQLPPEALIGKKLSEIFTPEPAVQFEREDRMVLTENRVFRAQQELNMGEGLSHWLSIKFPIELESERLMGGISLNVTEQVLLERETEQLYLISRGINEAATDEELLTVLAQPAFSFGADSANLLHIYTAENGQPHIAEMVAILARSAHPFPPVGTRFNLAEMSFAQFAIERNPKQAVLIANLGTDDRLDPVTRATMSQPGNQAFALLPLYHNGRWVGLLAFTWPEPHNFSEAERKLYQGLVDLAVAAVESRRLVKTLQKEQAMLALRVAERTADLSQANAELARAARLKDEFLANMSHELRTPLHAILGKAEILLEGVYGTLTTEQRNSLNILNESARHLLDLINDILDLSKIEAGKMEIFVDDVQVQEVIEASMRMVKQEVFKKQLRLTSTMDNNVSDIKTDMRRLKQMLVNLLSNAVKFTPDKGEIGLEVTGDLDNKLVHFTVWDTGIGIEPDEIKRLFLPFTQLDSGLNRSYGGTGLGLSLVARLAEMQGGSVAVESQPGEGSRFTVSLPWEPVVPLFVPPEPLPDFSMPPVGEWETARATILLVEDNEANIIATSEYLDASGYSVAVARNGLDALTMADKIEPDVILMDIQMPEMDGLEAIRRMRGKAMLQEKLIIALTALAMPGDRERCLEAGANAYVSKPVSLRKLVQTIEALLQAGTN